MCLPESSRQAWGLNLTTNHQTVSRHPTRILLLQIHGDHRHRSPRRRLPCPLRPETRNSPGTSCRLLQLRSPLSQQGDLASHHPYLALHHRCRARHDRHPHRHQGMSAAHRSAEQIRLPCQCSLGPWIMARKRKAQPTKATTILILLRLHHTRTPCQRLTAARTVLMNTG